jgi:uncharacterized phage-associated protein
MRRSYREDKTTQAAARLLARRGDRMSHLKLIKLLYLLDREALLRFGQPVTYDTYCAMKHGPVLSSTLDRINEREYHEGGYWDRYIAPKVNHEVSLRPNVRVPNDRLSPAEEALIDEIFDRYGAMTRWQLRDLTHELPEWVDPGESSHPIYPADILRYEGYADDEIAQIAADLEESAIADALFD